MGLQVCADEAVAALGGAFADVTEAGRLLRVTTDAIDPSVPPSGTGCQECLDGGGWWFHLRRCAQCGHIGCCDSSPAQHATAHWRASGHPIIQSFEPGEDWFWNYDSEQAVSGPELAPATSRPPEQPAPGPSGAVPADWRTKLHR